MNKNRKRILLAVSGHTPQIITETCFKLKDTGFDIGEIPVITTSRGRSNLLRLLSEDPAKDVFLRMCAEYGWEPVTVRDDGIHVFENEKGELLDDIRSDEDERCAANFMFRITGSLMKKRAPSGDDPEGEGGQYCPIVASIAGGRKTMSYLMGSTMSLLGRGDDLLTHVLVDPRYERLQPSSPKFYYPTKKSCLLINAEGQELDARDARVDLSFIPFIKLGHILKESKKGERIFRYDEHTSYSDAVDYIDSELTVRAEDLRLELDYRNLKMEIRNRRTGQICNVRFEPIEMAFYRLLLDNLLPEARIRKPARKTSSVQEIFRYWLRLFSYTPMERDCRHAGDLIFNINGIIDDIRVDHRLSEFTRGYQPHATAFQRLYDQVIHFWNDYADSEFGCRLGIKSTGMGQSSTGEEQSKKQYLLDYRDGGKGATDDSRNRFVDAHRNYWKTLQDRVNRAIADSECGDAVGDILSVQERAAGADKVYCIGLMRDYVTAPGYAPLAFEPLTTPDEELKL